MASALPYYSREEIGRLGKAIFDRIVKPKLTPEDHGKFVAIEVYTGDYEVDTDDYAVVTRLRSRHAAPRVWLMRAGYPGAYKLGLR